MYHLGRRPDCSGLSLSSRLAAGLYIDSSASTCKAEQQDPNWNGFLPTLICTGDSRWHTATCLCTCHECSVLQCPFFCTRFLLFFLLFNKNVHFRRSDKRTLIYYYVFFKLWLSLTITLNDCNTCRHTLCTSRLLHLRSLCCFKCKKEGKFCLFSFMVIEVQIVDQNSD